MKYTNLEMVQTILSSMDSDEVNSVNDTVESQQVLTILKTVHDDIISRGDLNSNRTPFNLVASTDSTKPILMTRPDGIDRIDWIKYDCQKLEDNGVPNWTTMTYLSVEDFIDYMHSINTTDSDVNFFDHLINGYTVRFTYRNSMAPKYYTSLDDTTLMFDSYDNQVDTTLQSSKTLCYGFQATDFEMTDSFIPNLLPNQFALLLNEAKSLAWAELKQTPHQKAEQSARRNWRHLIRTRTSVPDSTDPMPNFNRLPNFARNVFLK